MKEKEPTRLNNEELLKKIDELLSDGAAFPSLHTEKQAGLFNEDNAHDVSSVKSQIKAAEITYKYEELNHSSLVGLLLFNKDFVIEEANQTAVRLLVKINTALQEIISESILPSHINRLSIHTERN